ncbi:flippase [Shewanella algidipiscicola]|uniref:O-unit flippase n=1 Tax=Shewanella algidipiscicola TaxID=614070 RepID=A0ABQ4NS51_9GAMM|nr:flippase [Shewanella algidipiscicola]GIU01844.1 O-unit flippase [Shewanella algidipiscicola]
MTPFIKKALANTSWLVSEKVISMSANLLVSLALARSLGPEGFGSLSYLIALVALVAPLAALGLNAIITRELVNDPDNRDKIIASATFFRLIGALTGTLVCVLLAVNGWGVSSDVASHGLILLAIANIFYAFNVLEFWFQAQVAARQVVRMRLSVILIFASLKLVAVAMSASLLTIVAIFAAETLVLGIGFVVIYSFYASPIRVSSVDFSYGLGLLKQSYWLILSGIAAVIYLKVDQVMLENMVGTEAVGIYAVAARLSEVWYFFADAVVITLFPALLALKKKQLFDAYQVKLQQISDLLFVCAFIIAIAVSLVAKPAIVILFGQEYLQSAFILQLHIWAGLFIFMRALVSKWLLSEHLLAFSLLSHGLGAVINVIANLMLIPLYGAKGAAIATVFSYFIASYIAFWISPKTRDIARIMSRSLLLPFTLGHRYWPKQTNEIS